MPLSSQKYGFGIREKPIPDPGPRIQGSKRHRIPGSGFAALLYTVYRKRSFFRCVTVRHYVQFLLLKTIISGQSSRSVDVHKLMTCDYRYCVQVRGVVQYYVHYVDYNKRLDEWVTEDRLDTRKIEPPQVN